MIIVTGMDNTGKTTLAAQLGNRMKMEVIKSPGPIECELQRNWVKNQLELIPEVIFERFPLFEEVIYGTVLRNHSVFELDGPLFKQLHDKQPLIVYTRPSNKDIFNFGDREQMKGVIERKKELLAAYDELMYNLVCNSWNVIPYNFRVNTPEDIVNIVRIFKGESLI